SAAANTILARFAKAWPVFCARANEVSSRRSTSLNSILTADFPNANHSHTMGRASQKIINYAIKTLGRTAT
ncbi:MAG: hypothetical protein AAF762_12705, partial [Pseudomonadota bacterium]